jgi:hypothetical protein
MNNFKMLFFVTMLSLFTISSFAQTTLNISTPSGWVPIGSPLANTTNTSFFGHTNWMRINSPTKTTYKFKKEFYVCKDGNYTIKLKGYADNWLTIKLDNSFTVFDYNITTAQQFNTPKSRDTTVFLKCGIHILNASIINHGGPAGFYLDASVNTTEGKLGEKPCCQIKVTVCNCPEGWLANNTNIQGGVTGSGERQCKKLCCKPLGISPFPPNGTQLAGNIGFTWGDELWFYGTKENGGWPICTEKWVDSSLPNTNVKLGEGKEE